MTRVSAASDTVSSTAIVAPDTRIRIWPGRTFEGGTDISTTRNPTGSRRPAQNRNERPSIPRAAHHAGNDFPDARHSPTSLRASSSLNFRLPTATGTSAPNLTCSTRDVPPGWVRAYSRASNASWSARGRP